MAKKKKQVRNKARDVFTDYYRTNKQYSQENRQRQEEEGVKSKGLKNLSYTEKTYIVIIVLGLIGIFVKYVILR
ncbi:hypothetical protein LI177_11390 [bacterium 210820-DFI.6.37]|nr:hypothetical protein [bacterium 210820-DFI.6.37]